ncbi:MAG: hypothetical protein ACFFFC_19515 [Candidatus Thorarchaeota archaeon]
MTVTEKVQEVLAADAPLTAVVPANYIRAPGRYQEMPRPYIVHRWIAPFRTTRTHDGLKKLRAWNYQISIFADSFPVGDAVAGLVKDALDGTHGEAQCFYKRQRYWQEPETLIHVFIVEFDVHEGL